MRTVHVLRAIPVAYLLVLVALMHNVSGQIVTTFVGGGTGTLQLQRSNAFGDYVLTGEWGFKDASGKTARFNILSSVVAASDGTMYVADSYNHAIRMVTTAGVVTTVAGGGTVAEMAGCNQNGCPGFVDGTGVAARFNSLTGLALSADGSVLYVADTLNNAIRKVTLPGAVVTTMAGSEPQGLCALKRKRSLLDASVTCGLLGFLDGTGNAARFYNPTGLTVAFDGSLFVADTANHAIRKINMPYAPPPPPLLPPVSSTNTIIGRFYIHRTVAGTKRKLLDDTAEFKTLLKTTLITNLAIQFPYLTSWLLAGDVLNISNLSGSDPITVAYTLSLPEGTSSAPIIRAMTNVATLTKLLTGKLTDRFGAIIVTRIDFSCVASASKGACQTTSGVDADAVSLGVGIGLGVGIPVFLGVSFLIYRMFNQRSTYDEKLGAI